MRAYFLLSIAVSKLLWGGWNGQFDEDTERLLTAFPRLSEGTYLADYHFFCDLRKEIVKDIPLKIRLKYAGSGDKFLCREYAGLILKKRTRNRIHECFVWEASHLLGTSSFFVPSFPVEIGGKRVIVQKTEHLFIGDGIRRSHPRALLEKISIEEYWLSHLTAYILGMGDLLSRNIGINARGKIRFFDTESSFKYRNEPVVSGDGARTGFVMGSFEWPQYRRSLGARGMAVVSAFINALEGFEETLSLYASYRDFKFNEDEFLYRLEKVRSFPLTEESTFRDFYGHIFPKMNEGLDDLADLVSSFLDKSVDHGAALFFLVSDRIRKDLSSRERRQLKEWIETYIER